MSVDKYRSIRLCQMEVIVYLNVTTSSRVCCTGTIRSVEPEAATDLEKKIIKQNEVRTTIIRRSEPSVACSLFQKLDLQAIFFILFPESL